jgi:hypothetical protein
MAFSQTSVLIIVTLAVAMVIGIVVTAPSPNASIDRLKLIFNTLGLAIVVAGAITFTVMLVWGLLAGSQELIYLSLMPFAAACLTYGFITRRHMTWYGLIGFRDGRERWRSFWDETRRLWGYGHAPRSAPGRTARGAVGPAPGARAPPSGTRSFTFSFNLGGNLGGAKGSLLGPLARFAAHRLASDRVSVFPSKLHLSILSGGTGPTERAHLASYRQHLTVRRDDGGPLQLAMRTDLRFLALEFGAQGLDEGSYSIGVSLLPEWLEAGSYSGAITIETGDSLQPRLIVPVTATIG